jgi:hypothetical protein
VGRVVIVRQGYVSVGITEVRTSDAYDARVRLAIASFSRMPPEFRDDECLAGALRDRGAEPEIVSWDDASVDWHGYEAVVIRSTWDYSRRRDEFLAWAEHVGERLHNSPELIRWNSDKRYLGTLADAGLGVIETRYIRPDQSPPTLEGEIVVKPNISAGGRDTGRFGPTAHGDAMELIESIQASGRTAMVQPYQAPVDTTGETAVLCIDGEPIHALRKRAVLRPDEVAPVRDDGVGAAEVMYDPGLVSVTQATTEELANAREVITRVAERFAYVPLYARVDTVPGPDGAPMLMEFEAIEPNFYLDQVPESARAIAEAIIARARQ